LDVLSVLVSRLSGMPLTAAVLTVVAAVAVRIVLGAVAVLLREVPAIIEARRQPLVAAGHLPSADPRRVVRASERRRR
jgi:hypothetical protein